MGMGMIKPERYRSEEEDDHRKGLHQQRSLIQP